MKTLALVFLLSSSVVACKPGFIEAHPGVCSQDLKPEGSTDKTPTSDPKIVSDEKVPDDKMPSYQRAGIKADMPDSQIANDQKIDREKWVSEIKGKQMAKAPLDDQEQAFLAANPDLFK